MAYIMKAEEIALIMRYLVPASRLRGSDLLRKISAYNVMLARPLLG